MQLMNQVVHYKIYELADILVSIRYHFLFTHRRAHMKKTQGRKVKNSITSLSKKAAKDAKKITRRAKAETSKVKAQTRGLLGKAKKKLSALRKSSSKTLHRAKHKAHATEEEIMHYVKKNPVKSMSVVALTGLIAGFITSRYKK